MVTLGHGLSYQRRRAAGSHAAANAGQASQWPAPYRYGQLDRIFRSDGSSWRPAVMNGMIAARISFMTFMRRPGRGRSVVASRSCLWCAGFRADPGGLVAKDTPNLVRALMATPDLVPLIETSFAGHPVIGTPMPADGHEALGEYRLVLQEGYASAAGFWGPMLISTPPTTTALKQRRRSWNQSCARLHRLSKQSSKPLARHADLTG